MTDTAYETSFTDYLTLLRHEGAWRIVSKVYFVHE